LREISCGPVDRFEYRFHCDLDCVLDLRFGDHDDHRRHAYPGRLPLVLLVADHWAWLSGSLGFRHVYGLPARKVQAAYHRQPPRRNGEVGFFSSFNLFRSHSRPVTAGWLFFQILAPDLEKCASFSAADGTRL